MIGQMYALLKYDLWDASAVKMIYEVYVSVKK